jgi:hypothetical protein
MKNLKVYMLVVIALVAVATISSCASTAAAPGTGAPVRSK